LAPSQYGTKGLVGNKLTDVEEKYDLSVGAEGFGEEGDEDDNEDNESDLEDETGTDEDMTF
jgi:hypothetical protein